MTPMLCKMMLASLALPLMAQPALACPPPADAEANGCIEPLTVVNRADSFLITRRAVPAAGPSPRPASFLRPPPLRLGSNIWLDSEMLNANRRSPALPNADQEQDK